MIVRNRYLLLADLLLAAAAPILSFTIRFDTLRFQRYYSPCLVFVLLALLIKPLIFYLFGLYSRLWCYASMNEALSIAWAVSLSSAVVAALIFGICLPLDLIDGFPRSIVIIDWLLSLVFIGGLRFSFRLAPPAKSSPKGIALREPAEAEKRVLIVGAGDAGAMLVREMQANPALGLVPVGFIDDDPAKLGMRIHDAPVLGASQHIPDVVEKDDIDEAIIAMPSVSGQVIRQIIAICEEAGVPFRTLPGMYELLNGTVTVSHVREVRLEDLLRREPVSVDLHAVGEFLADARVMVTGAGGSIGAELCRQIAAQQPDQLMLLGHGENSVYRIQLELAERYPSIHLSPIIADIRHRHRIEKILDASRPTVVFHSAAHKHVPLMERNPAEAITNNVIGTRTVAQVANACGVERFVLISTDKAVNPVNTMGASKRVAELLIQDMARKNNAVFVAVRFGNVLGSRGSVVPLFQRQIAAGGPVAVTHPQVRRFFMTIPEAVQLVMQAAAIGTGGEIFVLDMGEPIKIVDLARDLIRLSGLVPGRDVDIAFTHLRPGEKLTEELFSERETPRPTSYEKILVAESSYDFDADNLRRNISELETLAHQMNVAGITAKLKEIIPEFHPAQSGPALEHGP